MLGGKSVNRRVNIHINGKEVESSMYKVNKELRKQKAILSRLSKGHKDYQKVAGNVAMLTDQQRALNSEQKEYIKSLRTTKDGLGGFQKLFSGIQRIALGAFAVSSLVSFGKALIQRSIEVQKLQKDLKDISGLTGEQLKQTTANIQGLSQTYNKNFKELSQSANTLSQRFGISMTESLDIIEKGFLSGADAGEDMLNQISEYSPLMKEAGISAQEMVAIIANTEKMGVFSDKGIDAIKEGMLSIREGTNPAREAMQGLGIDVENLYKEIKNGSMSYFEAMQLVSTKMKETGTQSTETAAAIADIFKGAGEDAGIDVLTSLGDINTELDNMIDYTDEITRLRIRETKVNQDLAKSMNEISEAGGIWNSIQVTAKEQLSIFLGAAQRDYRAIKYMNKEEEYNGIVPYAQGLSKVKKGMSTFTGELKGALESSDPTNSLEWLKGKYERAAEHYKETSASMYALMKDNVSRLNRELGEISTQAEAEVVKTQETNKKALEKSLKTQLKTIQKHRSSLLTIQRKNTFLIIEQTKEGEQKKRALEKEKINQQIQDLEQRKNDLSSVTQGSELFFILQKENLEIEKQIRLLRQSLTVQQTAKPRALTSGSGVQKPTQSISSLPGQRVQEETSGDFSSITGTSVLGYSPAEWQSVFSDQGGTELERFASKTELVVGAIQNVWAGYFDFIQTRNEMEFRSFEAGINRKKERLEDQLDHGFITQAEYNKKTRSLDKEIEREQALMEHNRAKQEQTMALFSIGSNTAMGVMSAIAASPLSFGLPWAPIIAGMGLAEAAAVKSTPLPPKNGYFYGGYTDGDVLFPDAYGGATGYVHKNEYVVPSFELADPEVKTVVDTLESKRQGKSNSLSSNNDQFTEALHKNNALLSKLLSDGVKGNIFWRPEDAYRLKKEQTNFNKIQ